MEMAEVLTVAHARSALPSLLRGFRSDPDSEAVVLGSHRKPEAVLLPFARYRAELEEPQSLRGRLHDRRELIDRLAALNNVENVELFGSVARGDDTPSSDIDFLVDLAAGATLFDIAQFEIDMEQIFDRKVDVVVRSALDPVRDRALLNDAVAL